MAYVLVVRVALAAFYADLRYLVALSFGSGVPAQAPFAVLFLLAAMSSIPVSGAAWVFADRSCQRFT